MYAVAPSSTPPQGPHQPQLGQPANLVPAATKHGHLSASSDTMPEATTTAVSPQIPLLQPHTQAPVRRSDSSFHAAPVLPPKLAIPPPAPVLDRRSEESRSLTAGASGSGSRSGSRSGDSSVRSGDSRARAGTAYARSGRRNSGLPRQVQHLMVRLQQVTEKSSGDPLHPAVLAAQWDLANCMHVNAMTAEALPHAQKALGGFQTSLGDTHRTTLAAKVNVASMLQVVGQSGEAEPLMRDVLRELTATCGDGHPVTLTAVQNLCLLLHEEGRYAEALPLAQRALDGFRAHDSFGPQHVQTLACMATLAAVYAALDRPAEARPLLDLAVEGYRRRFGPHHPETAEVSRLLREVSTLPPAANSPPHQPADRHQEETVPVEKNMHQDLGLVLDDGCVVASVRSGSVADQRALQRFRGWRLTFLGDEPVTGQEQYDQLQLLLTKPRLRFETTMGTPVSAGTPASRLPPRHPGSTVGSGLDREGSGERDYRVGEEVQVRRDKQMVAEACEGMGSLGFNPRMRPYCGEVGVVRNVDGMLVEVAFSDGSLWWWPRAVLRRPRPRSLSESRGRGRRRSAPAVVQGPAAAGAVLAPSPKGESPPDSPEAAVSSAATGTSHSSPHHTGGVLRPRLLPRGTLSGLSDSPPGGVLPSDNPQVAGKEAPQLALGRRAGAHATGAPGASSRLRALEEALQAGLFTQQEYEAKRADILAAPRPHSGCEGALPQGARVRLLRDCSVDGQLTLAGSEGVVVASTKNLNPGEVACVRLANGTQFFAMRGDVAVLTEVST